MLVSSFEKPVKVGKRQRVMTKEMISLEMAADEAFSLYIAFYRKNYDKLMMILKNFAVAYEKHSLDSYLEK